MLRKIRKGLRLIAYRLREQGLEATWLWVLEHTVRVVSGTSRHATGYLEPGLIVGGQYRRHGLARMSAQGVTAVVNMRVEFCDREAGIAPERYLRLATPDDHAPTLEQLAEGVAFIRHEVEASGVVYVHCGAGVGRAATMAAAYFVSEGLAPAEAWAKIRSVRPFIRPTLPQLEIIETWHRQALGNGALVNRAS